MTVAGEFHADLGATFEQRGGRRVVRDYGRPESAHRAVRNGAGLVEMGYGVVVIEGDDRVEFLDNAVSNRVPDEDGEGTYALLLDPQGRIETDMYVYNANERLLVFVPPSKTESLVLDWREKVFIQDVIIEDRTPSYGVFGVHGPMATEKVASVLTGATPPEEPLSFVRGSIGDAGVTVVATDAPTGEEGYEVVCLARDAATVADGLLTHGMNAAPFGYATWESLTLEAGTPLFETELAGRIPNVCGVRNAVDFEKGCFVGQEVVSKVENRGRPSQRLVGLLPAELPDSGSAVVADDAVAGEVTRAVESPSRGEPVALAFVDADVDAGDLAVRVDGEEVAASRVDLPFVEGSVRSARLPRYE
jgi:aminomethyltransferase